MVLQENSEIISVEDYLQGELVSDIKHEYLGGIVHAMAGGKMRHNLAASNVTGLFYGALKGKPCKSYNSDTKVKIQLPSQIRFYYPDAQVICEPVDNDTLFTDKPVVVVEVLSDSTRRLDVGEKRDAYLSIPSLKVLMIIDPARVYVNVDRRKPLGGFAQEEYRQLDQRIDLPEIEASLPVSDIYEGISLP
jgi:Uma2 family endonuclease